MLSVRKVYRKSTNDLNSIDVCIPPQIPLQGELELASAETAASHSPPRLSVIPSALPALCELSRCSDLYLVTQVMIPHHGKRVFLYKPLAVYQFESDEFLRQ
jgi:hypothetical protein